MVDVRARGRGSIRWRVMRAGIGCRREAPSRTNATSGARFGMGRRELRALSADCGSCARANTAFRTSERQSSRFRFASTPAIYLSQRKKLFLRSG
jgi:hypothetical protein